MSTSTIIGIIVSIALFGVSFAVCVYLYAQKNKAADEPNDVPQK